jgi:hypothetical protein
MKMRKCSKCKESFPATSKYFSVNNSNVDELYAYCRKCHSKYNTEMLNCNPKRLRKREEWNNSIDGRFAFLKGRAVYKNFEFTLTKDDLAYLVSTPCAYCGEIQENFNGVDRVDSSKGYTKDSCVSCCKLCNYMKNMYKTNVFLEHVNKIYLYQHKLEKRHLETHNFNVLDQQ